MPGKAPGKPFVKGDKRAGRPKGRLNNATLEIRDAARAFLADPDGQAALLMQYQRGELPPAVLQMFFHYAHGKPKETIDHQGQLGVAFTLNLDARDRDV